MVSDLGVIAAEPNWPIMLPFGILLLAIALGPLIARYHWERHYHQLCVVSAGVVCSYHIFAIHQTARVLHASIDYLTFMVWLVLSLSSPAAFISASKRQAVRS